MGRLGIGDGGVPDAHKTSHETSGSDEVNDVDINAGTIDGVTITSPAFAGTSTGTYTLGGTLTINAFTAAGAINFNSQNMTNVDIDSGTIGGITFDGTIAGGGQEINNVGTLKTVNLVLTGGRFEEFATDSDSASIAVNYVGYNAGTTRFRDLAIYDGKQSNYAYFDGSAAKLTVTNFGPTTYQGTQTLNSQVFDAGSGDAFIDTTGGDSGLQIRCTNNGAIGAKLFLLQSTSSPVDGDTVGVIYAYGKGDEGAGLFYSKIELQAESVDETGGQDGKMTFANISAGSWNDCMTLSSLGALAVDINSGVTYADNDHPVSVFDKYDDALILREGIQMQALDRMVDIGVFSKKDTGSGYMMNVQAFNYLLAGGIYQNRAKIDDLEERLARIGG